MTNSQQDPNASPSTPPTPPTPRDVAGIPTYRAGASTGGVLPVDPRLLGRIHVLPPREDLAFEVHSPPHLEVCNHLEDVLDVVGATPADVPAPLVVVRCSNLPRDLQRNVFSQVMTWPSVQAACPETSGHRVFVSFDDRPQLRMEFSASAVAEQYFESQQVTRWRVDKRLVPVTAQGKAAR